MYLYMWTIDVQTFDAVQESRSQGSLSDRGTDLDEISSEVWLELRRSSV